MDDVWKVVGIICRYILAALACWWFFWFLALIGQPAERSQELAGTAIGKAVICGGAAAIWFYRARKAKQVQKLEDYSVRARQFVAPVRPDVVAPSAPTEQTQVIRPADLPQDSHLPAIEKAAQPDERMSARGWVFIGVVFAVFVGTIIVLANSNKTTESKPPNLFDNAFNPQKEGATPVGPCPAGIPAGVQTVPVDDLKQIAGSDGHALYGLSEQWDFSFKVTNRTDIIPPTSKVEADTQVPPGFVLQGTKSSGYCITELQFEVEIRSDDGKIWKATGKQSFDAPLSPGWSQERKGIYLKLPSQLKDGNLADWRITKAWGFPLSSGGATK